MKFTYKPLVFGEVHNDLVTRQWLIDNLDALYQQGYRYFAFEIDHSTLDERIRILEQDLGALSQFGDPVFVDDYIEQQKRATLRTTYKQVQMNLVESQTTGELLARLVKVHPEVKEQFEKFEMHERDLSARKAGMVAETKLLLQLLQCVKKLGMQYTGLDNLPKGADPRASLSHFINPATADRNVGIAKRMAVTAKLCDGGVISLVGTGHLPGLMRELGTAFDTLPILQDCKDELSQFQWIRIRNRDHSVYDGARERGITKEITQLKENYPWLEVKEKYSDEATLTTLGIIAAGSEEDDDACEAVNALTI